MRRPEPEALYGGAAGGGKSDALIIEALRQVQIPHYRGLILRKTFPQLSDLVDKSLVYYRRAFPEAQYNATSHVWVFPSGAKIYFGSMQYTKDRTNYQGKAFDFIGFDELTHFEWEEYSYMMTPQPPHRARTRVYLRATTNPGGVGHGWVKARFITPAPPGTPIVEAFPVRMPDGTEKVLQRARVFIPSSVFDTRPCWKTTRITLQVWPLCPKRKSRPCSMAAGTVSPVRCSPSGGTTPPTIRTALDPCDRTLPHPEALEDLPRVRLRVFEAVLGGVVRGG